jgi:hypothetical protein
MDLDMGHVRLSARRLRDGLIMIVAMAALGPGAATASAATTTASTSTLCSGTLSRPFSPWSDTNLYTPAPGGDFETATSGWSLSGGAAVTSGSETFGATGRSARGPCPSRSAAPPSPRRLHRPDAGDVPLLRPQQQHVDERQAEGRDPLPHKSGTWKVILGGNPRHRQGPGLAGLAGLQQLVEPRPAIGHGEPARPLPLHR